MSRLLQARKKMRAIKLFHDSTHRHMASATHGHDAQHEIRQRQGLARAEVQDTESRLQSVFTVGDLQHLAHIGIVVHNPAEPLQIQKPSGHLCKIVKQLLQLWGGHTQDLEIQPRLAWRVLVLQLKCAANEQSLRRERDHEDVDHNENHKTQDSGSIAVVLHKGSHDLSGPSISRQQLDQRHNRACNRPESLISNPIPLQSRVALVRSQVRRRVRNNEQLGADQAEDTQIRKYHKADHKRQARHGQKLQFRSACPKTGAAGSHQHRDRFHSSHSSEQTQQADPLHCRPIQSQI
mmetsp:Transcript_74327/g.198297  ORF Transcript_74327/g.198297 Transcript_74327/m.198297 type:complete len:293 (+) Transcript_74327:399-1277(+)